MAQAMAFCLTAPSHYLNQCWHIISKVHWHSSQWNFMRYLSHQSQKLAWKSLRLKISFNSPRDQCVKKKICHFKSLSKHPAAEYNMLIFWYKLYMYSLYCVNFPCHRGLINSLHAKFFRGNINIYIYILCHYSTVIWHRCLKSFLK